MLQVNLISGQNDFNLGWFVISLSLFLVMNTRDKEITDQPRLNHFDLKSNSTCNKYIHTENAPYKCNTITIIVIRRASSWYLWHLETCGLFPTKYIFIWLQVIRELKQAAIMITWSYHMTMMRMSQKLHISKGKKKSCFAQSAQDLLFLHNLQPSCSIHNVK